MPRPEPTNRPLDTKAQKQGRTTALISVGVALVLGVATWFGLNDAADSGVARLARIDRVRAECEEGWRGARNALDTATVDRLSLPDTIDPGSSAELSRCANLRPQGLPTRLPNPREMSGEKMPGGLR
ncbi:MAG TPA: hypothetical protein VE869_12460 [Gemmatimonas sp.]|nr:hypothetical protein [Gemmatimonas sp.]